MSIATLSCAQLDHALHWGACPIVHVAEHDLEAWDGRGVGHELPELVGMVEERVFMCARHQGRQNISGTNGEDAMRLGHVRYRHYVLQERTLPFVLERHTAVWNNRVNFNFVILEDAFKHVGDVCHIVPRMPP